MLAPDSLNVLIYLYIWTLFAIDNEKYTFATNPSWYNIYQTRLSIIYTKLLYHYWISDYRNSLRKLQTVLISIRVSMEVYRNEGRKMIILRSSNVIKWFELTCVCKLRNMSFFRTYVKEAIALTFFISGIICDHISGTKKDNPCNLWSVLDLQSKGLNLSWIYTGTILFHYLMALAIQYSTLSLAVLYWKITDC